jgi:DNA-binding GntR family transcriptional regulator
MTDMALSPAAGHPYQALAAAVVALIREGKLKPGDQLKSIRQLSQEYNVTVATAQHAVQELVANGYVRTMPGHGTFVLDRGNREEMTLADAIGRIEELEATVAELRDRVTSLEATDR